MSWDLVFAESVENALENYHERARWLAGGTDLVPELKLGLQVPGRLVNLKGVAALRGIEVSDDSARLGALVTLTELARHELLRSEHRALAEACGLSASPQLRNMATIGGNLCQDSRCPYYRSAFPCLLNGGDVCFARSGENREAAVTGYRDCIHVHPSDPAIALVALEASVVVQGGAGQRIVGAGEFFRAPDAQDRRMNVLAPGELITALRLPRRGPGMRSAFVKAMDRAAWSFALVSAAVALEVEDGRIRQARVVLGGVAPVPWREVRIEEQLSGAEARVETCAAAAGQALAGAEPFRQNGYKVRLARALVKRALEQALGA